MKKIILILALFSLGVSKAQVVGGYLPLNSTKSATMGGLRVNGNETVTGTFSVGSTATLSGSNVFLNNAIPVLNLSSTTYALGRNNYNEGELFLRYVDDFSFIDANNSNSPHVKIKDRMFAINMGTVAPTHTLEVNGNARVSSTFSLGSANLTGGNTGTVAVLSDVTVPYQFAPNTSLSPADLDIRYCGVLMPNYSALPTATSAIGFYVNDNIEVVRYDIQAWNNGTVGSAENVTVSLVSGSSSTLGLLNNTITTNSQTQTTNTCSINVNSGTRILIEYKFPTYATNPTSLWLNTVLYTRRRQ